MSKHSELPALVLRTHIDGCEGREGMKVTEARDRDLREEVVPSFSRRVLEAQKRDVVLWVDQLSDAGYSSFSTSLFDGLPVDSFSFFPFSPNGDCTVMAK
jgi:hypothetical protein